MNHSLDTVAHQAIFGLNPMWLSAIILVIAYIVLITEKINRAVVALLGASLMIYCGLLNQQQAISSIDFNTIFLLAGMMMLVNITAKTGVFQYVAIKSAKMVRANPVGILIMICTITAVFSALLDNVTTVLLVTPVTLLITEQLGVRAFPYLFSTIISANIGGTATLIGDPPNILIGSKTHLTFNDFIIHMTPIAIFIMVIVLIFFWLIFRNRLQSSLKARARIMRFNENDAITDSRLLIKCGIVFALVLLGFFIGHSLHLEPGTIALSGAALLMLIAYGPQKAEQQSESVHHTFAEVEWITIFFFMGLFMIVGAVEHSGLLKMLGEYLTEATRGDLQTMATAVLWVSAVLSSVLDNIPFVATMIPLLEEASANLGVGQDAFMPVWWALALGACLGGNGTLIGASANLTVAAFAEKAKQPIGMLQFAKYAFPLMLVTVLLSHIYLWLRYF